ncbi:amidase [Halorubrum distributum]|uniref:amidase n=1 Tax=Halorubrum distributum TaxID=29283 RepID=UPI002953C951|nr:amidase [Halorubrum distributum]MDV7348748.1 amidase [Halorubrum distributum]
MTGDSTPDLDELAAVATDLEFNPSQSVLENTRDAASQLSSSAATVRERETPVATENPPQGELLDDEYGALLYGYKAPHQRHTDGRLDGYRVAVKDNIAVKGLTMTCGSSEFEYTPGFNATVVDRLLDAGAHLVGKANMDAFAFGPSGEFSGRKPVTNPIAEDRIPGGSSSGSGTAVAAGIVDVALGTDTGGSVRIPAACCGVVGVKPTFGAISTHGVVPFAPSLDTVGPLARDVTTATEAFTAIRGSDSRDATTAPTPSVELPDTPTFGIPESFLEDCTSQIVDGFTELRETLSTKFEVRPVDVPLGSIEAAYSLVGATEFAWFIRQQGISRGIGATYDAGWADALHEFITEHGFSDHVAERVLPAATIDARESGQPYVAGRREARRFDQYLQEAFADVDLLVTPTLRSVPHERGDIGADDSMYDLLGNTAPFNLTGHPAVTVPVAEHDGLPVSAQVVAPRFADDIALAGAEQIEEHANAS